MPNKPGGRRRWGLSGLFVAHTIELLPDGEPHCVEERASI